MDCGRMGSIMLKCRIEAMVNEQNWTEAKEVIHAKYMLGEIANDEMCELLQMVEDSYREFMK